MGSPVTAQAGFSQLIKGGELMLHQNAIQAARIHELEERLAEMTKRKSWKGKRNHHGGTMEYGTPARQVADETSVAPQRSNVNLRRLVVVAVKNQPNQLHDSVGNAEEMGTTRERANKM